LGAKRGPGQLNFMKKLTRLFHRKQFYLIVIVFSMGLSLESCYYDNEVDLYPNGCVSTNVTYLGFVRPFINSNCSCHLNGSADGGVILQTYTTLKTYVDNGKLLKVIKHEPGVVAMPQGVPKRSDCEIAKLEAWIIEGALEN
jgi:hypothetical protein